MELTHSSAKNARVMQIQHFCANVMIDLVSAKMSFEKNQEIICKFIFILNSTTLKSFTGKLKNAENFFVQFYHWVYFRLENEGCCQQNATLHNKKGNN